MDCSDYENCAKPVEINIFEKKSKSIDLLMVGCWGVYCDQGPYEVFKKSKSNLVYRNQKKVSDALKKYVSKNNVKDMFLAGDNVYQVGLQKLEKEDEKDYENRKELFFKKYLSSNFQVNGSMYDISLQLSEGFKKCFALSGISRFFIAIGNHDIENCEILNEQINYKNNLWNMPSTYYNVFYEISDFTINVLVIDTNMYEEEPLMCTGKPFSEDIIQKQEEWVKLQKGKADWTIVVGHIPYLANGHKEKRSIVKNKKLKELIDLVSPQIYFCADEHNQQFIYDQEMNRSLIIAGSGGTDLDNIMKMLPNTLYAKKTVGFVSLKIQKENAEITFFSTENSVENMEYNIMIDRKGKII